MEPTISVSDVPRRGSSSWYDGTVTITADGQEIGRLTFSVSHDAEIVETLAYSVHRKSDRRQGHAERMLKKVLDEFPKYELRESGAPNDEQGEDEHEPGGDVFLAGLRQKGIPYHISDCLREGPDSCVCPVGGRARK
ncbi:hypothetical protein L618_001300001160 [Rhodococcus rhodochrous J45]|uniref:Uncharacterized protein n=1 Tax=Rhodococcus rhodochrous J45 TaxID=935266 RepID=A0A562ENF7_RHORH|nr:hypothetical protein [Rhodococcus rhodochrous]TWH23281.1 hypothetical protein L618_001300001160 [Rhodococcus rhodochrous J45]